MAIKTMTAMVTCENKGRVTCTYNGEKNIFGKAIWRDADGNAYELFHARRAKTYTFYPYNLIYQESYVKQVQESYAKQVADRFNNK